MSAFQPIHDPVADEQASLWAARLEGSLLSAADQAALEAWLAENPSHRTLLSRYCQLSADLEEQLPALVAAGVLAASVPAGGPAGQKSAWRGRRRMWVAGAALATAALVTFALWIARPARQSEGFATAAAQRQSVKLADGTRVELNARTSLQVEIGPAERHVRLSAGEAFFSVTKDPARPFIVETPAGSVRVTGTVFNVRTETAAELNVTVVEGSVQVRPGETAGRQPDPRMLHAGDRLTTRPGGVVTVQSLASGEIEDELAWREGKIVFVDMPLPDAVARYAHYHGRKITVAPSLADRHVSGQYALDDLAGFLRDLEDTQQVRVTTDLGGNMQVSARDKR
jgi:transmembrane sensor